MSGYQYAKSDDPEVIEAILERARAKERFIEKAKEYAESMGLTVEDLVTWRWPDGSVKVDGLKVLPKGRGQWTQKYPHRPFRNNLPEKERMENTYVGTREVPGIPGLIESHNSSLGKTYWLTPTLFVHDGTAWLLLSRKPDDGIGEQWTEALGSEAHAAMEAYNREAVKA